MFIIYVVFFISLVFLYARQKGRNGKWPPGPTPWPIIGNLPHLGRLPHRTLQELAQRYGPLMFLKLGSVPTLVVSSSEMAKEFLKTHDLIFASRPEMAAGIYLAYNKKDLVLAPYGDYWRHMRKVCMLELLSNSRLQSYKSLREEEVSQVIDYIWEKSGNGKVPVNLSEILMTLTSAIIWRMLSGEKYTQTSDGNGLKETMDELSATMGAFNIGDFIPSLDWLDLQGIKRRMKNVHKLVDTAADGMVEQHILRNTKTPHTDDGRHNVKDIVDVLLDMARNGDEEIGRDNIKAIILDMFVAGTGTSAITMEWAMSELLSKPHVVKKVQEEIDGVVGRHRRVGEEDLARLEYLHCVVKEALRLYPTAPLLVPHESTEACTITVPGHREYVIPEKTRLIVNAWAIGRDPSVWKDPLVFKPERFMGNNIDVKGQGQDFSMVPFGSGRRGCPGAQMAIDVVELGIAQLLHCFSWKIEGLDDPSQLNMSEVFGVSIPRKFALYALPSWRISASGPP